MVAVDLDKKDGARPDGYVLTETDAIIFRCMLKSLDDQGFEPPAAMKLPSSIARIVRWDDVKKSYKSVTPNDELGKTPDIQHGNFKSRTGRFRRRAMAANLIGMDEIVLAEGQPPVSVMWPTGKRVIGRGLGTWPKRVKKPDGSATVDQATGLPLEVF